MANLVAQMIDKQKEEYEKNKIKFEKDDYTLDYPSETDLRKYYNYFIESLSRLNTS